MGIKQLFSIIKEEAPDAVKEGEIKNQFGRKVAIVSGCPNPPLATISFCGEADDIGCINEYL
jgi:hypothetical protein